MGVTELFTLALVLRDIDRGALALNTLISDVLPQAVASGLCVIGTTDYTDTITVGHLLSHQSGISDYLDPPGKSVRSLRLQMITTDRRWNTAEALEIARHYPGAFVPGDARASARSATNYLLIGELLRETTGMSLADLIRLRIVSPLGLKKTYLFGPDGFDSYFSFEPLTRGSSILRIPQALSSLGPSGGVISTPREAVAFLQALWGGALFDPSWRERILEKPESLGFSPLARTSGNIIGYTGINGVSVGINTRTGSVGFLALNQWASAQNSAKRLAKLLTIP
jgi:CubicO group peptidase (beta-lactamase class C family)